MILNNILSQLLKAAASRGEFGYYLFCREIQLTHLFFGDDLVVFTNGPTRSVHGVLAVMDGFGQMSWTFFLSIMLSLLSTRTVRAHYLFKGLHQKWGWKLESCRFGI